MKKSKILVLGLIALMLAGGLVLVGCDGGGSGSSSNEIKVWCGSCGKQRDNCVGGCTHPNIYQNPDVKCKCVR